MPTANKVSALNIEHIFANSSVVIWNDAVMYKWVPIIYQYIYVSYELSQGYKLTEKIVPSHNYLTS